MKNKSGFQIKKRYAVKPAQSQKQGAKTTKKINEQQIDHLFEGNDDIYKNFTSFYTSDASIQAIIIYCEGLCDTERLTKELIPEIEKVFSKLNITEIEQQNWVNRWKKDPLTIESDLEEIQDAVFEGQLALFLPRIETVYLFNIQKHPQRNPEESSSEISIRGARDGFIEEIRVNTALIRKRVRTKSLKYEEFTVGKRSKTKVGLFYIDDIAPKHAINEIRQQLNEIDIDGLLAANQLEELLLPRKTRLFPMFHYTGRPDLAADALLNGRFIILVNGSPTVLIAPVNLTFLLKAAEDKEAFFIFNSLERLLRIVGLVIATSLPGFWVALVTFHQNQLPLILVAGLAQVRLGVPLPTAIEALVMVLVFELFREAGLRLPAAIGQIISVVGGLIIGDAAIRAGLTNPAMLVIIATSSIATFSIGNQSFAGTISVLRLFILIVSSFLGMYGLFLASFSVLLYVAHLRSYGTPYMAPLSPLNWQDFIKSTIRPSMKGNTKRPIILDIQDKDKSEG
ncbi:hypothetical protein BTR23_13425 [Alkalihalophilus pseudofirmus]|nr:hypothetical protein BTR23_13425 [Alkalihalophilus pseudofirmus]